MDPSLSSCHYQLELVDHLWQSILFYILNITPLCYIVLWVQNADRNKYCWINQSDNNIWYNAGLLRSSVTFLSSHFLVVSLCSGQILSCDTISIANEVSGQIPDEQNKLQLSTIKNNSDLKVITQSNFELVESLTVNFKKF